MMSNLTSRFNLWVCKYLHKRMERNKARILAYEKWVSDDEQMLQERLKLLDLTDFYEFAYVTGYVDKKVAKKCL